MALNFPDSPSLNDTYTFNNKTWTWDGQAWVLNNLYLESTDPVIFSGTITEDATQTIYVSGSVLSPYVIDPSLGSIQTHLISGISQYYDDGLSIGQAVTLHLILSGSPSLFWPTMTWVNNGGSAPTLASLTIVSLWKAYNDSDTATLYGALVGDGS